MYAKCEKREAFTMFHAMTKVSLLATEVQSLFATDLKGLVIGILPALCYALYALSTHEMLLLSKIMLSVIYEIYFFGHKEVAEETSREGGRRLYSNLNNTQCNVLNWRLEGRDMKKMNSTVERRTSLLNYTISRGTLPSHRYKAC